VELRQIVVTASPRLNETQQAALDKQRKADNIVSVMSGDEIRALPNANAAEAAARIPGVSTERDEGEGKFVQIRGTEPRLSNVTVD
jgi:outer membrane receptor for ferrienterochelin and colicin